MSDFYDQGFEKKASLKFPIFIGIYIFFIAIASCLCVVDKSFFLLFLIMIVGVLGYVLYKELQLINRQKNAFAFQRDIAIKGYDGASCAFFIFSTSEKCIFLNKLAQDLFPGIYVKSIEDLVVAFTNHGRIVNSLRNLQSHASNGTSFHVDAPLMLENGKSVWWRISVAPLSGYKGFSVWSICDLTPSVRNTQTLESNSAFLLDIFNNSSISYFSVDNYRKIIFCNKTFAYWTGKKISEIINNDVDLFFIKEKSDALPQTIGSSKLTRSLPAKMVIKCDNSNGVEVVVRQILVNEDGSLSTFMANREIGQNGDLALALGKTKLYFEHIFEDAPVGIVITENVETISACNRTFREILINREIEDGESFLNYIIDDDKEIVRKKLYELNSSIKFTQKPFEARFRGTKSSVMMIYATRFAESKVGGCDSGNIVLYLIDVTARKELQEQFVQSQKLQAVGQLAGGIAHDFNNLLTAMIGYCDLLLTKHSASDQSFSDIMQIKQNANRASNLVRQLLAFSRRQTLQPKVLSVTDVVNELSALLRRLIGAKVELKVIHGKNVECVRVDQVQFEQVIINLVVNARDAMPNGGILTIQTSNYICTEPTFMRGETMPAGKYVLIEISDTGSGISQEYIARIFEPFFSTKEKGSGTGLGLSTVHGIVNQTGGFISVSSVRDEFTTFSLYFPSYTQTAQEQRSLSHGVTQEKKLMDLTGTGTILLVEDEDAVRLFSARALKDKGYRVIEASDGEVALEFMKKTGNSVDLVITDVVMPKMDGPTLVKLIKDIRPNIKVIFTSGYIEDNFRESLANDTSVHFLHKPFSLKDLASKVKEVISSKNISI